MKPYRFALLALVLASALPLCGQKQHRQPLTEPQIEQIREASVDPDGRIHLYTHFLEEHFDAIESLGKRGVSTARTRRLDDELQDLTALMDELGENLDQYGERKADLRKSLKQLRESAPRWLATLHDLPHDPGYGISCKEAQESARDLADQAAQLEKEQVAYFAEHKDERGQERAEPK